MDGGTLYVLMRMCRVCGQPYQHRKPGQTVCSLNCVYHDPEHSLGFKASRSANIRANIKLAHQGRIRKFA